MQEKSLSHTKWECKYHIVRTPRYRKKTLFKEFIRYLGEVIHGLTRRKECKISEGTMGSAHVHIRIEIPPEHSVSQVVGYIKGKSVICLGGRYGETIKKYIKKHEDEDRRYDQLTLFD